MKRVAKCLPIVSVLVPSLASAVTIGLYSTPDCASCNLDIALTQGAGTFYVAATNVIGDR
jgi:hypothetical protein